MGQQEVSEVLEKEDRWMTTIEVVEKVESGRASVNASLNKLFKEELILKSKSNKRYQGNINCIWRIK